MPGLLRVARVLWYVLVLITIVHAVLYLWIGLGIPELILFGMVSAVLAYAAGVTKQVF